MSDDIVIRLRTSAGIDDVHDAADLIEAQAAEIARLRADVLCLRLARNDAESLASDALKVAQRRIARQRRALAKLCLRRHDKNSEIARLRDAINNALLEPWSGGQLSGTWHQEPIGPNETPEEAIKRLVRVRAEWAVYRNNCENPEIAELRAAIATAQVTAFKKAADIARQFAQSEGWSGASALRLRNCIIAEAIVYAKTRGKDE